MLVDIVKIIFSPPTEECKVLIFKSKPEKLYALYY